MSNRSQSRTGPASELIEPIRWHGGSRYRRRGSRCLWSPISKIRRSIARSDIGRELFVFPGMHAERRSTVRAIWSSRGTEGGLDITAFQSPSDLLRCAQCLWEATREYRTRRFVRDD